MLYKQLDETDVVNKHRDQDRKSVEKNLFVKLINGKIAEE